jgi:hypothetical protein
LGYEIADILLAPEQQWARDLASKWMLII